MQQFNGFDALANHFAAMARRIPPAVRSELDAAGTAIEREAKQKLGTYQAEAGPFAAWKPLADVTKLDRLRRGFPADEPLLRTGDMRDSIEHKRIDNAVHVGSDDPIANYQELGTNRIPPRSFLGAALYELADGLHKKLTARIGQIMNGGS